MTNADAARLRIAALVLPVTFGLACIERDWSLCSPQDKCKPGYVCTSDWKCVPAPDGGIPDAGRDVSADAGGAFDSPVALESGSDSSTNVGTPDASSDVASIDVPAPAQGDSALSLPPDALPDAPADVTVQADTLVVQADAPLEVQADAPLAASADAANVNVPPDAPARDTAPDAPPVDAPGTCSADKDCSPGAPLCLGNRCAKCTSDNDCTGRQGTPACATSGLCVACTTNQHCTGAAKTCDTATNQCVGCVKRSDCADACQTCTNGVCTLVKTCANDDACCATGCNANTDNDCKAVCDNGVVEPGETCDPVSSCESASQACVGDSSTVRTRKGDTKACTFACQESVRQCGSADGYCPTGCLDPPDPDCPKSNGQTCSIASECSSGFCANGVCCNRACTGACEQCTAASGGQCSYKTGTVCNAGSDCMDAAVCSGTSGACPARQPKSAGAFCGSVTCSGITQSASTCDGAGNCGPRTDTNCSPFACVSGTGCKKSCATNADCVADSSIFCGKTGACQTDTACWRDLSTNLL
jgi:hypothetical protein